MREGAFALVDASRWRPAFPATSGLVPERSQRACQDPGATSRVYVLAIGAVDVETVAAFWCAVLGYDVVERDEGGVSIAGVHGPAIDVLPEPDAKTVKNRLHLDLRADGASTAEELTRLEGLGARRVDVGKGSDVSWTVLVDPEGNEFCLLSRTVEQAASA